MLPGHCLAIDLSLPRYIFPIPQVTSHYKKKGFNLLKNKYL